MRISEILLLAALIALTGAGPAVAEVCDKMNPAWSRANGPVGQWGDLFYLFTGRSGAIVLGLFVASLVIGRWWMSALSALLAGLLAWFHIGERWFSDTAYLGAIKEGCLSEPYAVIAVLAVICGLAAWRGVRIWRRSRGVPRT